MSDPIAQALAAPVAQPPMNLDAQGCVGEDIPCRRCGYNLRGLSPEGRCPECGIAVGRSLLGDYLRFAEPHWVRTLASGSTILLVAIALTLALGSITAALMGIGGVRVSWMWLRWQQSVIVVTAFVGYWKLTTPDPGTVEDPTRLTARRLVRIAQTISVILFCAPLVPFIGEARIDWIVLPLATGVIGIVNMIAIFIYARQLALRIRDEKMAKECTILMACTLVMHALNLAQVIAMRASAMGGGIPGVKCVTIVMSLLLILWLCHLLWRFRKAFRQAANYAAANWAAEPPGA